MTKPISLNDYRTLIAKGGKRVRVEKRVTHNTMSLDGQGRDEVVLDLPIPPSANRMNAMNSKGQRWTSTEYSDWKKEAMEAFAEQGSPKIGPAHYEMVVHVNRTMTKMDVDNSLKPVSDLLQALHVIKNDNLAESVTARRCPVSEAPRGIRVHIKRVKVPA